MLIIEVMNKVGFLSLPLFPTFSFFQEKLGTNMDILIDG